MSCFLCGKSALTPDLTELENALALPLIAAELLTFCGGFKNIDANGTAEMTVRYAPAVQGAALAIRPFRPV